MLKEISLGKSLNLSPSMIIDQLSLDLMRHFLISILEYNKKNPLAKSYS
jgi:hypothetical protein